ncbi:MAG: hypothetical protein EBZ77_18100, partial [Chitinophagia bacterium]|nr:hypothetical protein [Chitinophagia bacterium]
GTKTIDVLLITGSQPPGSAFATRNTRNSIAVLEFNDTTQQAAVFLGVIKEGVNLTSGIMVRLFWMGATATSGNVRWGVAFERGVTDLDADSFDTEVQATAATSSTSGVPVVTEITVTTIDGLTAGDLYRLRVQRIAADATNDTMSGNAQLVAVEVRGVA